MTGHFSGEFVLDPFPPKRWWRDVMYEFRLDPADPLTWNCGNIHAQPDRHFISDGGSTFAAGIIPAFRRDRYWPSYAFHDSAYKYGGWYVRRADGSFVFVRLTRQEADEWLYRMLISENATEATAKTVWGFVRSFGWFAWDEKRQAAERHRDGISVEG